MSIRYVCGFENSLRGGKLDGKKYDNLVEACENLKAAVTARAFELLNSIWSEPI